MPFVDDPELDNFDDVPIPNIGTDLFENLNGSDDEHSHTGPVVPEILQGEEGENGADLPDSGPDNNTAAEDDRADEEQDSDESDDDEDEDIPSADAVVEAPADPAPAKKKRGRPASTASRSATPKTTPKAGASAASRKRKAVASEDEPAVKRRGRGRATAAAASGAIKLALAKRPRAAPGTAKTTPKATGRKRGPKPGSRTKKVVEEEETVEEYEVEKILGYEIDDRSKELMYHVKWKGYEESENTWEPKKNLAHAADLMNEFDTARKAEKKKRGPKKSAPAKKDAVAASKKRSKKAAAPAGSGRRPGRPKKS